MDYQRNHKIFNTTAAGLDDLALEMFRFQSAENPVYKSYLDTLGKTASDVKAIEQIPFLPIRFFKTHQVKTGSFEPAVIFESSGTTGSVNSQHLIKDLAVYEKSFLKGFEEVYGSVQQWCILGLLPSYLERQHSSLVYMFKRMIEESGHVNSGFYLHNQRELADVLKQQEEKKDRTLLIGVTYALLDLAEKFPMPLQHTVVVETGGMKGRRKEMIRAEVHAILKEAFRLKTIHSEYGMTELLSQAWSTGEGIFGPPSWMKILIREEEDPLSIKRQGAGIINIIDLANVYSCSFLATDDTGFVYPDGSFEVLGRVDGTDLRGCNLLVYQ